jgi:hypothetical protein
MSQFRTPPLLKFTSGGRGIKKRMRPCAESAEEPRRKKLSGSGEFGISLSLRKSFIRCQ